MACAEAGAGPGGAAPDPRTARTDRKILAGALKLLREAGPQRVTIEAVSVVSGVAKTSIYRRYHNSAELLEAALEQVATPLPRLPEDVGWEDALGSTVRLLLQDMGIGVALTLLENPRSETARILRRKIIRPRMEALRALLQREVDRGLIRPNVDLDVVIDFVLGAAYAHTARYGQLDAQWPQRVHRTLTDLIGEPHQPPESPDTGSTAGVD